MRSSRHAGSPNQPTAGNQTEERQCDSGRGPNLLRIVGLGPGRDQHLSPQAREALQSSDLIIGYKTYIAQIEHLLTDQEVISSGMTKELDRAALALESAQSGRRVAVVSGGDAGIYAMAGVVFELARVRNLDLGPKPGQLQIEVIPGIPALAAAAALLGAPLTHDFACISLSDRLTPWELIEKRLDLAAEADFVIVLYNPKSKTREWQFGRAIELVRKHRADQTPVGIVTRAMRDGQAVAVTTIADIDEALVDMQTVVIIGNSQSHTFQDYMITPRGYLKKYDFE